MKEIIIISGKGGTGKTTLTASVSKYMNKKVICDADVDAADMFLLMKPEVTKKTAFRGKSVAIINSERCTSCDLCRKHCRFNAIDVINGLYTVNPYSCDGCSLCTIVCPTGAVKMEQMTVGEWYVSQTKFGKMVHARLYPGAENSGNLVTMVKRQAHILAEEENADYVIVDGPPGIGCPVTSTLSGANLAIIVTEPTFSGIHDLERVYETAVHFKTPVWIVINKYDLNLRNSEKVERFAKDKGIEIIEKIPFSRCVIDSVVKGEIPADNCKELRSVVERL
ncbi:MAG: (4Fe-4S)-binding protein, partial [Proteobacteria bacterium]|nr:(4Fe-4S)-binding protein [Pseudomonadota bacterium]